MNVMKLSYLLYVVFMCNIMTKNHMQIGYLQSCLDILDQNPDNREDLEGSIQSVCNSVYCKAMNMLFVITRGKIFVLHPHVL